MNRQIFLYVIFVLAFGGVACSSKSSVPGSDSATGTTAALPTDGNPASMGPAPPAGLLEKSRTTAADGSEIVVSTDGLGNQVSVRTVSNHPRVSSIKVEELADGSVLVSVTGKRGEKVQLSPHLKTAALRSDPTDFANMAGFPDPGAQAAVSEQMPQVVTNPISPVSEIPNYVPPPTADKTANEPVKPAKAPEPDKSEQLRRQIGQLESVPGSQPVQKRN